MTIKKIKLKNSHALWKIFQNLKNVGPLIWLLGLDKNPKLLNIGPTSILDSGERIESIHFAESSGLSC